LGEVLKEDAVAVIAAVVPPPLDFQQMSQEVGFAQAPQLGEAPERLD